MIEHIFVDNFRISELETSFPQIFVSKKVNKELVDNVFTNYLVYIVDNKIVGFINYDMMYERAELIQISVLESFQNQQVATKLLNHMIKDCQEKKVRSITLEVRINNDNAIHLYQKLGFRKISMRKGYYHGIDGLLMEKEMIE